MNVQINQLADLLLINHSDETVNIKYLYYIWKLPLIGPRPPYYTNPKYVLNYPII